MLRDSIRRCARLDHDKVSINDVSDIPANTGRDGEQATRIRTLAILRHASNPQVKEYDREA
jgi:hypothetical protein